MNDTKNPSNFFIDKISIKECPHSFFVKINFCNIGLKIDNIEIQVGLGRFQHVILPENVESNGLFEREFEKELFKKLDGYPEYHAFIKKNQEDFLKSVILIYGKENLLQMQTRED